jgi:putative copper resistance protein D
MIDLGLVVARLLHYAAVTTLAGASFFPLYAYAAGEPNELFRWRQAVLLSAAVAALLSGLLWFVFSVANMSGTLAGVADREVLWTVARDTGFGVVWTARMLLAVILVGVTAMRFCSMATTSHDLIMAFLAAVLLASLAGTGHSQIAEGWASVVHVASDAAHLLGAGAWLGGLIPLGFMLLSYTMTKPEGGYLDVDTVLLRFSGMGYVAVATLIGSGLVNSWFLVGSVSSLLKAPYGQILLGKLAFVCCNARACRCEPILARSVDDPDTSRRFRRAVRVVRQVAQSRAWRAVLGFDDSSGRGRFGDHASGGRPMMGMRGSLGRVFSGGPGHGHLSKRSDQDMRLVGDPERILTLHAVGIFGNSMPGDRIVSRRQRRWQWHDELLLILWIGRGNAGRDCLPAFIFDFNPRKFRDHAFAETQLDLRGGDLARNIGRGAGRCEFRMSTGGSSKQANRQNCEGTYCHRIPGHSNSFL